MSRPQSPVSRAHDKLGVGLVRFAITGHIRGARTIDVTASTPGFAALLLERGADHVASLDVGPSPLPPKLKADPRVSAVERAQLKILPATALPGPFSFFTIDVKFISSRSALRALAFRLRPDADGIVWLRPAFEVPAEQVKAGAVTGEALHAHALSLFREKAENLGFHIASQVDAPPDKDAEIMLHIIFKGRPAPAPKK